MEKKYLTVNHIIDQLNSFKQESCDLAAYHAYVTDLFNQKSDYFLINEKELNQIISKRVQQEKNKLLERVDELINPACLSCDPNKYSGCRCVRDKIRAHIADEFKFYSNN